MKKPILIYTRPHQWEKYTSDVLELMHAPVFGERPMLRSGQLMGDSVGGVAMPDRLNDLVTLCARVQPQAFLFWSMYGMHDSDRRQLSSVRTVIERIKVVSPNTVVFYGNGNQFDTILNDEPDFNVIAYKNYIDVVLDNTVDSEVHACYTKHGIAVDTFYTFGFDPDTFVASDNKDPEYDCFFGGSYTGKNRFPNSHIRHRLVTAVHDKYKLLVRGRGVWPVPKQPYLHAEQYQQVFNDAKIALGCYHADLDRYYTKRTIYSLASGRPYCVRYIPHMENDFEADKHLLWWHSVDHAIEQIDRLLNDKLLYTRVSENGRRIAVENHSWRARLRDIEKIITRYV